MSFLYVLEGLRCGVLDALFSVITLCGEETVFMAVGMIVFWCIDKHHGYFLLCVGFLGTVVNQFLKMLFRVPRPWDLDPSFTIVESAREAASGYSFPSGHTQTAVGLFGGIARMRRERWLRIAALALCVLVPLSRMYLGVHTPLDVGVSIVLATSLVLLAYPLFERGRREPRVMYTVLGVLTAVMVAYLLFITLWQFPPEVYTEGQVHNLVSARKNGFTLMGCLIGLLLVYTVDEKHTHFETRAVWWVQLIKALVGIALVVAAKELLRFPLDAILPKDSWARLVRYLLMVIVGGVLWPMTFRRLAAFGEKHTKAKETTV